MDLVTFGVIALIIAIAGVFASLILGIGGAVARAQERRYVARSNRRLRTSRGTVSGQRNVEGTQR